MQEIESNNKPKYLNRLFEIPQFSSGSLSPFGLDFFSTGSPIDINQYIKTEIAKQLIPIKETQKALIDLYSELTSSDDSIKEEVKNIPNIINENYHLRKKIKNMNLILSYMNFSFNWNGNDGEPFSEEIIKKALDFINLPSLKYQPNVFPTSQKSIQMEYEKLNGDYLEIEIFEKNISAYSENRGEKKELENISLEEVLRMVDDFHSRF